MLGFSLPQQLKHRQTLRALCFTVHISARNKFPITQLVILQMKSCMFKSLRETQSNKLHSLQRTNYSVCVMKSCGIKKIAR